MCFSIGCTGEVGGSADLVCFVEGCVRQVFQVGWHAARSPSFCIVFHLRHHERTWRVVRVGHRVRRRLSVQPDRMEAVHAVHGPSKSREKRRRRTAAETVRGPSMDRSPFDRPPWPKIAVISVHSRSTDGPSPLLRFGPSGGKGTLDWEGFGFEPERSKGRDPFPRSTSHRRFRHVLRRSSRNCDGDVDGTAEFVTCAAGMHVGEGGGRRVWKGFHRKQTSGSAPWWDVQHLGPTAATRALRERTREEAATARACVMREEEKRDHECVEGQFERDAERCTSKPR